MRRGRGQEIMRGELSDNERESYRPLRTSWVVPGIASPSERLLIDDVDVYVLPYGDNSRLDKPLSLDEQGRPIGDESMLDGLYENEKELVRDLAAESDKEKVAAERGITVNQIKQLLGRMAVVVEQNCIIRRMQ